MVTPAPETLEPLGLNLNSKTIRTQIEKREFAGSNQHATL
jgi:hypothetical protein